VEIVAMDTCVRNTSGVKGKGTPKPKREMRTVEVQELETIRVYEMQEHELKGYRAARDDEQFALALFTGATGMFLPLLPTWPTESSSSLRIGLHLGIMLFALATSAASWMFLRRKRRERLEVEEHLDKRALLETLPRGLGPS
jgi:hypothetical protein